MSFRAKVYDHASGRFLLECRVTGRTLEEAESRAIAKAALCVRGDPATMDVRHLHEVGAGSGERVEGRWHGMRADYSLPSTRYPLLLPEGGAP